MHMGSIHGLPLFKPRTRNVEIAQQEDENGIWPNSQNSMQWNEPLKHETHHASAQTSYKIFLLNMLAMLCMIPCDRSMIAKLPN